MIILVAVYIVTCNQSETNANFVTRITTCDSPTLDSSFFVAHDRSRDIDFLDFFQSLDTRSRLIAILTSHVAYFMRTRAKFS